MIDWYAEYYWWHKTLKECLNSNRYVDILEYLQLSLTSVHLDLHLTSDRTFCGPSHADQEFSYSFPQNWGGDCTYGNVQSPINIPRATSLVDTSLPVNPITNYTRNAGKLYNNGYSPEIVPKVRPIITNSFCLRRNEKSHVYFRVFVKKDFIRDYVILTRLNPAHPRS